MGLSWLTSNLGAKGGNIVCIIKEYMRCAQAYSYSCEQRSQELPTEFEPWVDPEPDHQLNVPIEPLSSWKIGRHSYV